MKRMFAVFFLLLLSSCGFKPLYYKADSTKLPLKYEQIEQHGKDFKITYFVNHEIAEMIDERDARYVLKVSYDIERDYYFVERNSDPNSKRIKVILNYEVAEIETGTVKTKGRVVDFGDLALSTVPFVNFQAEEDLILRILMGLIQEMRLKLVINT